MASPLSAMTCKLTEQIGHLTRSVLGCSHVVLLAWDPRTDVLRPLAVIGLSPRQERLFCKTVPGKPLHDLLGDPSLGERLRAGETLSLDLTLPPWQRMSRVYQVHAAWIVPLRLRGQAVGILCLSYGEAAVVPSAQAFALAEAIANLVALVLERERLLQERAAAQAHVITLARTDPITGRLNHRALLAQLSEELEQAQREQRSFSVLVIDLDHFKAVNDGYGHVVGDAVLAAFAQLIGAQLLEEATVGRWGGEEFVVLLPGQASRTALRTAEQVRGAVAKQVFAVAGGLHLTCSIGVASFPQHAQDRDTLISCADHAMYAAKYSGRNQVRLADDAVVQALENRAWRGGEGAETVDALVNVVAAREQARGQHADRVGDLVLQGAHALGISASQAHRIALAERLHDVGKLAIPDGVLQKPGPLSQGL